MVPLKSTPEARDLRTLTLQWLLLHKLATRQAGCRHDGEDDMFVGEALGI